MQRYSQPEVERASQGIDAARGPGHVGHSLTEGGAFVSQLCRRHREEDARLWQGGRGGSRVLRRLIDWLLVSSLLFVVRCCCCWTLSLLWLLLIVSVFGMFVSRALLR